MTPGNALYQLFKTNYGRPDPGDAGSIRVNRQFSVFPLVSAAAETRTLAQPSKEGLITTVEFDTDVGTITLTVTGGYNADGDTSLTLADAGDFVTFISIKVGSSYYWRVLNFEGVDVAMEDLSVDQLTLGGTLLTATAAEINDIADVSAQDLMAPSAVIDALIEQYVSSVRAEGNLIKTEILIDLTGGKSTTTDKDIIGNTGICHFGQITAAINGAIYCGQMTCLEVPATGADDIDLYMSSAADGAYDADGSALANAASLVTKGGAWAVAPLSAATVMTAPVTDDYYLYLLSGEAGTAATYTAGKFLIELWGE